MNNKGFAISGLIYTVLIIFIILLFSILSMLNSRKNVLDTLKNKVSGDVNVTSNLLYDPFTESGKEIEFVAKARGYYSFTLYGAKFNNINGSQIKTEIFLNKGEKLYLLVGSSNYNNGNTEVRYESNNGNSTFIKASDNSFSNTFNNRAALNTTIKSKSEIADKGKIVVEYLNRQRQNTDLNKVRYVRNCTNGNSANNQNNWAEIKAISDGINVAQNKKNINYNTNNDAYLTDNNLNTIATSNNTGKQCVTIDLENTYNLDYIIINHKQNLTYYANETYVSIDNVNYIPVHVLEQKESEKGIITSAYDNRQVELVGNVYVPTKDFGNARWIRLYHHNNRKGSVMWTSISQPIINGGIDKLHMQSILYALSNYKMNNQYEFLLEYSDITGYNRWIQTSNPLTTQEAVSGYKPINISWTTNGFKGLAKSSFGQTLLDGTIGHPNWFYAIGDTAVWTDANGKIGVPGPEQATAEATDLWIRIE